MEEKKGAKKEQKPAAKPAPKPVIKPDSPRRTGLMIFLVFLIVIGLFVSVNAFIETQVTSEANIKYAVTKTAMSYCETEAESPATDCQKKALSKTEFSEDYTYQILIDDVVNFVYYGGGKGAEEISSAQKAYLHTYRLKNFFEYSQYAYLSVILAVIGLLFLIILFIKKPHDLIDYIFTSVNITVFLIFLYNLVFFLLWILYLPHIITVLARSTAEPMELLFFGASFGFSLSKLHMFVAIGTLILFIVLMIIRRTTRK
ncbi:hypothetical protein ACFL96_04225 [Thermoproteota archaeon]